MPKLWIGVDIGNTHHHIAAIDTTGRVRYSRRVANDESVLLEVIADVTELGRPVCWAVDLTTPLSALLLTLLWQRHYTVRYVSGTVAHHMAAAFAGEHKTDARDAVIIAQTVRLRCDIPQLKSSGRLLADLKVLTAHRADLIGQRVAAICRLQETLTAISPALQHAVDLKRRGPLLALAQWQTPAAIRHAGPDTITALLHRAGIPNAAVLADTLHAAACRQTVRMPGERAAALVVRHLTADILALAHRTADIDEQIAQLIGEHPLAGYIRSLPGMGPVLTAELLVHTNGMTEYDSPAKLAAHAGLAPVTRDSGAVSGNHHSPRRYHRVLRNVFWMSAYTSLRTCPASRTYYDRKRAEGKHHYQALIALARRRVDVLWALTRDHQTFDPTSIPTTARATAT
ncbi:IS110 family transposase [Krasilnikovia sp. MM14-A1004]|uniref:IS110 family transposase n=1 Tax=Krasilnikovia sp. MM14-A1004 TaxID=3373541 RepID=UPI00399D408D